MSESLSNLIGKIFFGSIVLLVLLIQFWRLIIALLIAWVLWRVAWFYGYVRPKISAVKNSAVVSIRLKSKKRESYAIALEVKQQKKPQNAEELPYWIKLKNLFLGANEWVVKVVYPELNSQDRRIVNFPESFHKLNYVRVAANKPQDLNFQTMRQISHTIKDLINKINPQISAFNEKKREVENLKALALSSEVYRPKAELYARAAAQIQELIVSAEQLREQYLTFIRETLIGAELARYDPENLPDVGNLQIELSSKYQVLRDRYETLKEEIKAYSELSSGK